MKKEKIGVLHPGAMGVSIAASAQNTDYTVYWASEGRSRQTHERANKIKLRDMHSVAKLCGECSVILSVCPPHAAEDVSKEVIDSEFRGVYLDANAISPQRATRIGQTMSEAGVKFVDGGIIGGPAWQPGRTWLYLSGKEAQRVASYFSAGPLETSVIGDSAGKASALKMCYTRARIYVTRVEIPELNRKSSYETKYIFVTGGVLSSVGKGSVCASIGKLLQVRNYTVTAIKIDPYLNVDAGTMNPYMHGEVFVCEDGGEMDLDLGTYERFLDITISREANITTGQIYWQVIDKERRGDFLGECVQIIPHITNEIKHRIRDIGAQTRADIVLVECGGTIGDIEGLPFFEAFRQIRLDEGVQNTVFVHVPLVPVLDITNEQKSKPAQHSIQELRRIGLQPDLIVARCRTMLSKEVQTKIALFGSVENDAVFASPNVETVYQLPLTLDQQGLGNIISNKLNLPQKTPDWRRWTEIVDEFLHSTHKIHIAVCGKYAKLADSYISINEALKIAAAVCHSTVHIDWIETETIENRGSTSILHHYDGILVPGGFGERGTEGKIAAIQFARENNIPFLGLCFGFQLAVVEYARNVCTLTGANSTETNTITPNPVINLLPEQGTVTYKGATMRLGAYPIRVTPRTLAAQLYRVNTIYERHRHRYEVNPEYIPLLTEKGLKFSGKTEDGVRMEILELPHHYFYLATQFHPEFKSRPGRPDPAFYGFIKAILDRKLGQVDPTFDHQILDRAEARMLRAQLGA